MADVIAEPVVRLHADGVYRVTAELDVAGRVVAQMECRFLVGDPPRPDARFSAGRPGHPTSVPDQAPAAVRH